MAPAGDRSPRPGRGDPAAHTADPDPSRTDCQLGARSWPQRTHRHEPAVSRWMTPTQIAPIGSRLGSRHRRSTTRSSDGSRGTTTPSASRTSGAAGRSAGRSSSGVSPPERTGPPLRDVGSENQRPGKSMGGGCASLTLLRAAPRPSARTGYGVGRPVRGRSVRSASVIGRVDATLTSGSRASSAHTKLERLTLSPSVLSRKRLVRTP